MEALLRSVYPEYPWDSSSFRYTHTSSHTPVPRGHWTQQENLINALSHAEKQLGITKVCISISMCWFVVFVLFYVFVCVVSLSLVYFS